jgi:hypothetical protein
MPYIRDGVRLSIPLLAEDHADLDDIEAKFVACDWIGVGKSYNLIQ